MFYFLTTCSLLLITLLHQTDAFLKTEQICTGDSCYSCLGSSCTRYCSGAGCLLCRDQGPECCLGQTLDCLLCFGSRCCEESNCNRCIDRCMDGCDEVGCYAGCFDQCLPDSASDKDSVNTNALHTMNFNSPFNVTTTINITNTINNTNLIEGRISANSTGYNNVSVNVSNNPARSSVCCTVIHPEKTCYRVFLQYVCENTKHVECSSICNSSSVILITSGQGKGGNVHISNPPYMYQGDYQVIDCQSCFCNENSSSEICSKNPSCPELCKSAIEDKIFDTPQGKARLIGVGLNSQWNNTVRKRNTANRNNRLVPVPYPMSVAYSTNPRQLPNQQPLPTHFQSPEIPLQTFNIPGDNPQPYATFPGMPARRPYKVVHIYPLMGRNSGRATPQQSWLGQGDHSEFSDDGTNQVPTSYESYFPQDPTFDDIVKNIHQFGRIPNQQASPQLQYVPGNVPLFRSSYNQYVPTVQPVRYNFVQDERSKDMGYPMYNVMLE